MSNPNATYLYLKLSGAVPASAGLLDAKIPQLSDLDVSAPDYVSRLEQGIAAIAELHDATNRALNAVFNASLDTLVKQVCSALPGVRVRTVTFTPTIEDELDQGYEISFFKESDSPEVRQKAQELMDTHMRAMVHTLAHPLVERINTLFHAGETFSGALVDLTKVEPLTKQDPDTHFIHLYILRSDGVYESHLDLKTLRSLDPHNLPVHKSEFLKPEWFSDADNRAKLQTSSEFEPNAYVVTSPSSQVYTNSLAAHGFSQAIASLRQYQEETGRNRSPLEAIRRTLDRAVAYLKR